MNGQGTVRVALAFAVFLVALAAVVHRQSSALVTLRELDALRSERAVVEAERADIAASIQWLESRARVAHDAGRLLGLRVPSADEMVVLPLSPPAAQHTAGEVALESGADGFSAGGQP